MRERWETALNSALSRLQSALDDPTSRSSKDAALTAAIATDKVLLLQGRPTNIVANLHKHDVGALVDRLRSLAGQVPSRGEIVEAEYTLAFPAQAPRN
jgi:hypothetical protein